MPEIQQLKFVCTSDTHGKHSNLTVPEGDVFIFSGDMTNSGSDQAIMEFNTYLGTLSHKYKIVIDGNHDFGNNAHELLTNAMLLQNNMVEIGHVKIWASSWSYRLSESIRRRNQKKNFDVWESVPNGIDILITHIPPYGIRDLTTSGKNIGSKSLLDAIKRIKPKYHIFGHAHQCYGISKKKIDNSDIIFINSSAINEFSEILNPPKVFTL